MIFSATRKKIPNGEIQMTQVVIIMITSPRESNTVSRGFPALPLQAMAMPMVMEKNTSPSTLDPTTQLPSIFHSPMGLEGSGTSLVWYWYIVARMILSGNIFLVRSINVSVVSVVFEKFPTSCPLADS
uniref:Uncharacterized protein n=1 Tax=Cacopsylla melanoneura TaxID=428564 RepID=A0A8D8XR23_9HEMI